MRCTANWTVLRLGLVCGLGSLAVESALASSPEQAGHIGFAVPRMWEYSAPLIAPERRPENPSRAQKDPTVVFYGGKWHVFMTVKLPGRSAIEYCSFEKWEEADRSRRTILKISGRDYYCAPQVFYFAPHKKWYLIYQMGVPGLSKMWVAYSTTEDIADPGSWTQARPILDGGEDDPRRVGGLDYWIICDGQRAYLFLTSLNGKMWRLWTRLEDFPRGFDHCELALEAKIFEASHTYKLKGVDKYLTIIEENGRRYYKAYLADRLDGKWTPVADTAERPFAGWQNIRPAPGVTPWTDNVSHGELIRDGYDQTLTIEPGNLRFIFQGVWDRDKSKKGLWTAAVADRHVDTDRPRAEVADPEYGWRNETMKARTVSGVIFLVAIVLSVAPASLPARERRIVSAPKTLRGSHPEIYKRIGDVELPIHIFLPEGHRDTDKRAAIVFFFGGGWRSGSPAQFRSHCKYLASRGMVAMTVEYRVLSRHGVKAVSCFRDAKSAIRWVRKNAERLGVDPRRVAAGGGSAGGHLAGALGTIGAFDEEGEDTAISSTPNALILFNPALVLAPIRGREMEVWKKWAEMEERMGVEPKRLSPFHHVRGEQPPTIIFHGKADTTVPYITARLFAEKMRRKGNRCELVGYDDQPHGFFNYGKSDNKYFVDTVKKADAFLVSLGYLEGPNTVEAFVSTGLP